MFALLVACALGQASSDPVMAQRTWLFNALEADLQAKGQTDPARLPQVREQIGRLTPNELQTLVNLYQSLKQDVSSEQGTSSEQVNSEAVNDRDQSVMLRDQLRLELDLRTHLPVAALMGGAGYAGGAPFGTPIYGGLPTASMSPGNYRGAPFNYGGSPLPFAGPMGFGTFSATGPVLGYSAPFLPGGGAPWPMRFGP